MICQWQFQYSNGFECKIIPGVGTIIINVVLSEYRVKVGVMLKEEEEGYMASIDAVARSAARALLGSPRPWSHLDQSFIFCFSNFTQPHLARVVSLNMIVYIKSILVTGPQGCIFQV